ncbi:hypothetical protein [Streptomyces fuscichromogenes]|uniref:Uncharacterized protein n=1 Tax=Streptomyces fuscichromogenes TaxID=1324013 RepID=A0A918CXW8_9ACTN|nr:hypothetical protein [Streptomyces fuscichromogenes]GGN45632.1 hypothetical protein GCM10011578_097780 [Streptomyces fuscichromogenes]
MLTTAVAPSPVVVPPDRLAELARLLNDGGEAMPFAGAGCADAHDEVMAVAGRRWSS